VARRSQDLTGTAWLIAGAASAGLTLFVAALGTRAGLWDAGIGLDLLTFRVVPALVVVGLICALVLAVRAARRPKTLGVVAALALLAVGGVAAGLALRWSDFQGTGVWDVTSDAGDPPGFSRLLADRRTRGGAAAASAPTGPDVCPGAAFAPTQVAPETAARALEEAGFTVIGAAPFRAEGERRGFWFGLGHDAVVRIRPGRTDVRVTARTARAQGDEACRLAAAVARGLAADQPTGE
jgi:hypothetical protein